MNEMKQGDHGREDSMRGFSLMELTICVAVISIAMLASISAIGTSSVLLEEDRELKVAADAAREMIEQIKDTPFNQILQRYAGGQLAADPTVTAAPLPPGGQTPLPPTQGGTVYPDPNYTTDLSTFKVPELNESADGQLIFPLGTDANGLAALVETYQDANLGMPRDLDGDGVVDGASRNDDYTILPLAITIDWTGRDGQSRSQTFYTILAPTDPAEAN